MKKCLFPLCLLLGLLAACTDSPNDPIPPEPGSLTVTLTPASGDAFTDLDGVLQTNELIELTATVRRDNAVVTERAQVIFEIAGTGAAFVETLTTAYNTYTVNGAAAATLFSTAEGAFAVKATARISDNASANTTKTYTFTEYAELSITGISPVVGSSAGGDTVTITGTGFAQPIEVYFGGRRAQFVTGTSTEMTVTTPVHYSSDCNTNDVVDVSVVLFPGQTTQTSVTESDVFTFLFDALEPTITGIDPNHGDTDGGTLVTIYGSNFYCGGGILVYFQGDSPVEIAAPIVSCSPDKLVVKSPPAHDLGILNCTEPVSVRVLNLCGGLSYNLAGSFKYGPDLRITAWGPSQGPSTGGTRLIIYGQGFDAPMAVSVVDVGGFVTGVSNNELLVTTGVYDPQGRCGNATGRICVTDIECGTDICTDPDAFTYIVPELFISSISPTQGLGGASVTIEGQGLIPNLEVFFGDTNAVVVPGSVSADFTSFTVTVPLFTGQYDTLDCTTGAPNFCPGTQNQPTPVDVTVRSLFTGCEYTFKSFFYVPPGPVPALCLPEAPVCSMSASAGVCSATFTAEPLCGATYTWSGTWGTCPVSTTNIYTCTGAAGDNGPASASLTIQNAGGAATCSASTDVAGCP